MVVLVRAMDAVQTSPVSLPASFTVVTQTVTRKIPASAQANGIAASLQARDPLLDAMAFSKGRFAVMADGLTMLSIPSWAEVSKVVEDCR